MDRLFADLEATSHEDITTERSDHSSPDSLSAALLAFDACRSQSVQSTGFTVIPRRVYEHEVIAQEPIVKAEILRIHDALSEAEQLRIYRFYLTAMCLHSLDSKSAEYGEITSQLEAIVDDVAKQSLDSVPTSASLFAANFLWTFSWWVHARQDVMSFEFIPTQDAHVVLLQGRVPSRSEHLAFEMYSHAADAERKYHRHMDQSISQAASAGTY